MSQIAALALLDRYYTAFNAGDWEGMLACLSDDVAHDINQGARQVGKDAFRSFLAHMERCYAEQLHDLVLMASADGTRASAEFVVHGQYLNTDAGLPEATGQRYVLPAGAFFAIENGLIARVTVYYNLADWEAQVIG
ncbi:ketosteroid isomerase-related protein [Novosphingobium sp.]|jgi:steroid delta-isomerase-like uncharacterized protein|uniref:ketosteroid isomerase-related protein n=1 Tax=Novosphingobium sp. TaxID=1874826 RepID=UPI0022C36621|nr:ketosteroid isomerase-related protein [Novosphingobium sp.]MCZ8017818.1 nuclear transport factor 2 family protein [Novosphingobium sp.]MCZ8033658.1 nuclear transport factor 2 family protein [Novosphingobium sp.]MCZ8051014.1 nuclear transport factor 2 family protein [Novosphingobium sp.]MCZ8059360.1 nuclear transport factor 2 family protein [Novosphingobium sp.]MCZ8231198.1 nuclear transport factor 2 family protein [Novosphingobium sp.]